MMGYFDEMSERSLAIHSVNLLQFPSICGMLLACLTFIKGGHNDRYGRVSYARGGRTKAETPSRHHRAVVANRQTARLQGSGIVADQSDRARGLDETAQEHENTNRIALRQIYCGLPVAASQTTHGVETTSRL